MQEQKQEQTTNEVQDAVVEVETKAKEVKEKLINDPVEPQGQLIKKTGIEGITVEQELETVEEKPAVKKTEDLREHTDSVQTRINQLTRKMREAERREKAAMEYAKGVQKQFEEAKKTYSGYDDQYLKEFEARVDAETATVKTQLKSAIENQDADAILAAQEKLTNLAVQRERAKFTNAERALQKKSEENKQTNVEQQIVTNLPPEPSKRAQKWAENNEWFGSDKIMTNAAYTIHEDLVSQGFDTESDEYYTEIDKQMKETFPHKFSKQEQSKKIVQTVAPAGRTNSGRRTVRLTKSQVAIAKKLGVPLEEYAKYVKEGA
jgi:hypothetical protein